MNVAIAELIGRAFLARLTPPETWFLFQHHLIRQRRSMTSWPGSGYGVDRLSERGGPAHER
jgi:hypothetical protein